MGRSVGSGWVLLATFTASVGVGRSARAETETIDGKVRLGLETGLVTYQSLTQKEGSLEYGTTREVSYGLDASPLGPVIGYAFNDGLVLNAQPFVRRQTLTVDQSVTGGPVTDDSALFVGMGVNLEFLPGDPLSTVRPFIAPVIEWDLATGESPDVSYSQFTFGGRLGAHAFVLPNVSIDPSLWAGFITGSGTVTFDATPVSGGGSLDYDANGFIVGLRVGVSAWLGGRHGKADDENSREPFSDSTSYPASDAPSYTPSVPPQGPPPPLYPAPPPAYAPPAYPSQPSPAYAPPSPAPQTAPPAPAEPASPSPPQTSPSTGSFPH